MDTFGPATNQVLVLMCCARYTRSHPHVVCMPVLFLRVRQQTFAQHELTEAMAKEAELRLLSQAKQVRHQTDCLQRHDTRPQSVVRPIHTPRHLCDDVHRYPPFAGGKGRALVHVGVAWRKLHLHGVWCLSSCGHRREVRTASTLGAALALEAYGGVDSCPSLVQLTSHTLVELVTVCRCLFSEVSSRHTPASWSRVLVAAIHFANRVSKRRENINQPRFSRRW